MKFISVEWRNWLSQGLDWHVQGGMRFPVLEIEMPPFERIRQKTVPDHDSFQQFRILRGLGGNSGRIAVRAFGEVIEVGRHA